MPNDQPITDLIAEARALDAKATKGPWSNEHRSGGRPTMTVRSIHPEYELGWIANCQNWPNLSGSANGSFIARSRILLPALADLAEQQQAEIERLRVDNERMKAGTFTLSEVQNFCHNLPQIVSPEEFANGCAVYQQQLYGCSPYKDRIRKLEAALQPFAYFGSGFNRGRSRDELINVGAAAKPGTGGAITEKVITLGMCWDAEAALSNPETP